MKRLLTRKNLALVILIIVSLSFGNLQEKAKLSLNNLIRYSSWVDGYDNLNKDERRIEVERIIKSRPIDFFRSQEGLPILYTFNQQVLVKVKWLAAFAFIAIFLVLNSGILYLLFKDKRLIQYLFIAYGFLVLLSAFFYFFGSLIDQYRAGYAVARKILGLMQSLIPVMLIYPVYHVYLLSQNK